MKLVPNPSRDRIDTALEVAGIFFAMGNTILAVGIVLGQCGWWLRYGEWPALDLGDGLGFLGLAVPAASWVGLDRLFGWIASIPLSLFVLAAGWAVGIALSKLADPILVEQK